MILEKIKKHLNAIKTLEIANACFFLSALFERGEPATLGELNRDIAWKTGMTFSPGQRQKVIEKLLELGMVTSEIKEQRGSITVYNYSLTEKGTKLVKALDKFLQELEE